MVDYLESVRSFISKIERNKIQEIEIKNTKKYRIGSIIDFPSEITRQNSNNLMLVNQNQFSR